MPLSPEAARERLKAFEVSDWAARRARAIGGLGGEHAKLGRKLLEMPWYQAVGNRQVLDEQLDRLSSPQRTAVFAAIQPQLGAHLDRMWTMGPTLPYQYGEGRKAFRAPTAPKVSGPTRLARLVLLLDNLRNYEPDPVWVARWAPHLSGYGLLDGLGNFLAAVIEGAGPTGDEVYEMLVASASGEDEVGAMGRHVTRALLTASRPDGHAFLERLLLAAQRQEGLRQTILEAADEAHPTAFRRLLSVIVDHDLARFTATIRALDTWLGYGWGAGASKPVNDVIARVIRFLDEPAMGDAALRSGGGEDAYLALWVLAFGDAVAAVPRGVALLDDADAERRYAAVHLLVQVGLNVAVPPLVKALDDPDLRVAARALAGLDVPRRDEIEPRPVFDAADRLLGRLPAGGAKLDSIIWPWNAGKLERSDVTPVLIRHAEKEPIERVLAHLPSMDSNSRLYVARKLASTPLTTLSLRRALIGLAGDPSASVRDAVLERAVPKLKLLDDEVTELESLLTRKASDLRRAVVGILLNRGDPAALDSADRLLAANDAQQRLAGLEILRRLSDAGHVPDEVRTRAAAHRESRAAFDEASLTQLDAIRGAATDQEPPTLDDALGLLRGHVRPKPAPPRDIAFAATTPAATNLLLSLDEEIHANREVEVTYETFGNETTELLGNITYFFPHPNRLGTVHVPPGAQLTLAGGEESLDVDPAARLPLRETWDRWYEGRGAKTRDPDGFELLRAIVTPGARRGWSPIKNAPTMTSGPVLRYEPVLRGVLAWLLLLHPPPGAVDGILDGLEAALRAESAAGRPEKDDDPYDTESPRVAWTQLARLHRQLHPDTWSADATTRFWSLLRWHDEGRTTGEKVSAIVGETTKRGLTAIVKTLLGEPPKPVGGAPGSVSRYTRRRPAVEDVVAAHRAGAATDEDFIDQLIGARSGKWVRSFQDIQALSSRRPHPLIADSPALQELVTRVRDRIVEVELGRGEAPTAASTPALAIRHSGGLDTLARLLRALGKEPFVRGWTYDGESRSVVFSRLIRATHPAAADTPDAFAARLKEEKVPEKRLVELGTFAPQWAEHVERAVGWDGLSSAIWWMHAHTKDEAWSVEPEIRETWTAEVAERTPLTAADLVEGAVDVDWFGRVYAAMGPERWKVLDGAAKYGSTSGGHIRAQLFANAMRGTVTEQELATRIGEKRHQDSVRALGLVPLPEEPARDEAVLARYRALHEFIRTSRQFGSARQASEKRAAQIGLQNLARTAGHADPIRLGWAMEARGVADLADGPLTVSVGDLEVALRIDEEGSAELTFSRAGTPLKALPADAKKDKDVAALRSRATDLRRQSSRIRASLETAMVRGDPFSGAELHDLARHPLLAPQLRRLMLVGDGIAGYPIAEGRALLDHSGREHAVGASESLRLAHPVDLLAGGEWTEWQRDVFRREVVQPFKQVFRELYVPTAQELEDGKASARYAGHQVNPRQALALLGGRGWVLSPEEGVRRTFHDARLSAWLAFLEPFHTPAELEGLTLEQVIFAAPGDWRPVPLGEVPPRLFSEVMRDLDLVVSVAHAGAVDPEASASSVELRATLVSETTRLLGIENVRIEGPRALVDGQIGEYSVHLGSAMVHRRPGGALFIVPVHAQHRGRLFLPFADDDPKTAEVLSKVLLLARDQEIKDPRILDQIRNQ